MLTKQHLILSLSKWIWADILRKELICWWEFLSWSRIEESANLQVVTILKWQQVKAEGRWEEKMQSQYGGFVFWQEIDGQALLLLTLPTVQECMDLKLGPAIKLCHHIERVKLAFYQQFANWEAVKLKQTFEAQPCSFLSIKESQIKLNWQPRSMSQPPFFTLEKRQHLEENASAKTGATLPAASLGTQ